MSSTYINRIRDYDPNRRRDWRRVAHELRPGESARFGFLNEATARATRARLLRDFPGAFDPIGTFVNLRELRVKRTQEGARIAVELTRAECAYLARRAGRDLKRAQEESTRATLRQLVERFNEAVKKTEKSAEEC